MIKNFKKFPKNSGVYFFRDKNRRILYIGKAANLKNRIKSYFSGQKDWRISKMLKGAASVDWQEMDSEIEALILESRLIKKCRPPFNIMLRDDKQYFYIVFTKETFPRIFITHQPKGLSSEALAKEGPFTDGGALRVTLKLLRRIFPYCTCKQKHNNYCLNYHIGNCPGFCCLKKEATAKEINSYKKNVEAIKEILNGRKTLLIRKLEKDMAAAAKKESFEKAIGLRDQLEKIKGVFENSKIIHELELKNKKNVQGLDVLKKMLNLPTLPKRIEGYDISNMQGEFATGAMAVFTRSARSSTEAHSKSSGQADFQPDKNEYRKFKIRRILPSEALRARPSQPKRLLRRSRQGGRGDTQMLAEILHRRFNHLEWQYPDLILIDGGKGQLNTAVSVLKTLKLAIPIVALTKNINHIGDHILSTTKKTAVKIKKLPPAVRNLILQIDAEAHRFAINYYRKLHRKSGT